MRLFLIDLDDTLIDTGSYKLDLFNLFSKETGLKRKEIEKVYESIRNKGQLEEEWLTKLTKKLAKKGGVEQQKLIDMAYGLIKNLKFIPGMLSYVDSLEGRKVLLTVGDKGLQQRKVKVLRIGKHFDKVIYVTGQKKDFIESLIKENKLIIDAESFGNVEIIDDKDHLLKALKKYPFINIVHPKTIK